MNDDQAISWVLKNCKFAMRKQAGIIDFIGEPIETISNPHQAFQMLQKAYRTRAQQFGPSTPKEIEWDLAELDQRLFDGQPVLNTPENVAALAKIAQPAPEAPQAAPASRFQPDPVEQFMAQKRKQDTTI